MSSFGAFDMNQRGTIGSSRGCSEAAFPKVYESEWEKARLTRPEDEVLEERALRQRLKSYERAKAELGCVRRASQDPQP